MNPYLKYITSLKAFMAFICLGFISYQVLAQDQTPVMMPNSGGHHGLIRSMSFHAASGKLFTVSQDKTIQVWNGNTGEQLQKIYLESQIGYGGMFYASALAHDQSLLAVAGYPGEEKTTNAIYLLSTEEIRLVRKLEAQSGTITTLRFSPVGSYLASGSTDGKIMIFDYSDAVNIRKVFEYDIGMSVYSISFAYDRMALAIGSESKDIKLLELDRSGEDISLSEVKLIPRHFLSVTQVEFSADSASLFSGGKDHYVHRFTSQGKFVRKMARMDQPVTSMSVSDDSKILAVFTETGNDCRTFSLPNGEPISSFRGHDNTVYTSAFFPSGSSGDYRILSAGSDNSEIHVWNALNGRVLSTLGGKGHTVWDVHFDGADHLQVSFRKDNAVYDRVFHFNTLKLEESRLERHGPSQGSLRRIDAYSLRLPGGRTLSNDPLRDGRINDMLLLDTLVIVGSDFSLKAYNLAGSQVTEFIGHSGGIYSLAYNPLKGYLVSGGDDQVIQLWNVRSMHDKLLPQLSLFITEDDEWVCWSPEGYFASSDNGADLFGWITEINSEAVRGFRTASQYFSLLYHPEDIMESYDKGLSVYSVLFSKGERIFELGNMKKPSMALFNTPFATDEHQRNFYIDRLEGTYTTDRAKISLQVDAFDGGAGIRELSLFQNDKLVMIDDKFDDGSSFNKAYEVSLVPGQNHFKVVAQNFQHIDSRPDHLIINYSGTASAISDLYVFNIGINAYMNESYNLNYAQPDSYAFAEKIVKVAGSIFDNIYTYSLYDEEAVKDRIIEVFSEITEKASLQDVFIFYYAGHGTINLDLDDEYFLVPHDVPQLYGNADVLKEKGISASELRSLLSEVRAQKQLILLDACHSGGAVELFARRGSPEEKAIIQLARSSGTVLLSASGTQQYATEFDVLQHGVFTYALLEALDGIAEGGNTDKKITVNELKAYMEDRVPQLSEQYGDRAQYPTGFIAGQDFPIAIIGGEDQ